MMYDVTIIGAGVAGIFLAHELMEQGQTVLLIDAGKPLAQRTKQEAYLGFGGLGKSEGKYNYSAGFGGELAEKLGAETTLRLMHQVDALLCRYGADEVESYSTSNPELADRAQAAGLETIETTVRHLGTALSERDFKTARSRTSEQVTFRFETAVATNRTTIRRISAYD